MQLNKIFEQVINETHSLDELFVQGLKLCLKAEKLIIDAIVNGCKPFALNEADNTNINNITDNISLKAINDAETLINNINSVIEVANQNAQNQINPHFINPNSSRLAYQQYLRNIQNTRNELNDDDVFRKMMDKIEENLRNRITEVKDELETAENRLTEMFNTYNR